MSESSELRAPTPARIGLFVGKGGVGKSTLACATAVGAAGAGQRVLVVSTDQAHSLGDVLGVPVPPGELVRVLADLETDDGETGGYLDALALDTLALLEQRWQGVVSALDRQLPESELSSIAPQELSALPGVQELLGLHAVGELAASGRWQRIVVDCASTADALRMLTLPATVGLYVERAWPRHRRLSGVADMSADDSRSAPLVELLEVISASVEKLSALLTDGDLVGAHLVLTPERVVAAEAVRTLGSLALMGVRVQELIVNQVLTEDESYEYHNLPDHPAFDWYAERIAEQHAVLDELEATIGDVALVLTAHLSGEPIGPKALSALLDGARRRGAAPPPGPLRPVVDLESGSGLGSVYRLRLALPQLDPGTLSLGRVDDDLIVSVGGLRRRVRLASVLRRCTVLDASLRGSELTVRFRPDPEVWPR